MKLELFIKETCPYRRMVMSYIGESNRTDVEYRDINKSDDIINWLKKN